VPPALNSEIRKFSVVPVTQVGSVTAVEERAAVVVPLPADGVPSAWFTGATAAPGGPHAEVSALAAAVNVVFGLVAAWVLVRYQFPGRRFIDSLVDLPFALPTAVAGIALTKVYMADGWVGRFLPFKVAFTPLGVFVALVFIGLPFVVRTVQPVLLELPPEEEEAAACLGASRVRTLLRVVLPHLRPALFTGFALALARGMGEYGSVIFISANLPFRTEIPPLLIVSRLEQYDYLGATVIACILLVIAFVLLFVLQVLQRGGPLGAGRV